MASPQAGLPAIPDTFSPLNRLLVQKTEEAIRDGRQLESWMRRRHEEMLEFPLALKKTYTLPNRAFGYFGSVELNGAPVSVMGARQEVDFGRVPAGGDPAAVLRNFVLGEFLKRAHWTYPDGFPGGFTIEQSLYRKANEYGEFEGERRKSCVDWRQLGGEYAWVLLTVQIHDFVMNFGPVVKRFQEAACVAMHADFVHVVERPAPGYALEVAVGYPFVEFAPIPNVFGFGPGKFGLACKLYSFLLGEDRRVKVVMNFAAAPRCRRVFDFGKNAPDPVYGGAALLRALTFGKYDPGPFHDRLDSQMLAQHSRVHQALMEGTSKVWNDWVSGGRD